MNRNKLNYLNEDQFSELAKNGSAQDDYGITHEFAEGDLYVTEDGTGGTGGGKLYWHLIRFTDSSGNIYNIKIPRATKTPYTFASFVEYIENANGIMQGPVHFESVVQKSVVVGVVSLALVGSISSNRFNCAVNGVVVESGTTQALSGSFDVITATFKVLEL